MLPITGLEDKNAPEPTLAQPEAPSPAPAFPQELQQPKAKQGGFLMTIVAILALLVAVGACGYAFMLQKKIEVLQVAFGKLAQRVEVVNGAALSADKQAIAANGAAKEVDDRVSKVEQRMDLGFHKTDEYLQKTLPTELKRISTLESQMNESNKSLIARDNSLGSALQSLQLTLQTNDSKFSTLVQVVRNQDSVLRRIVPSEKPEPKPSAAQK